VPGLSRFPRSIRSHSCTSREPLGIRAKCKRIGSMGKASDIRVPSATFEETQSDAMPEQQCGTGMIGHCLREGKPACTKATLERLKTLAFGLQRFN
jgi:hypothetical protein